MENLIKFFHNTKQSNYNIIKYFVNSIYKFIQYKSNHTIIRNIINETYFVKSKIKYSKKSIIFFNILSYILNIKIQHSCNDGEFKTKQHRYYVDGYHNCLSHQCSNTKCMFNNVIFEFNGNYYHGNPLYYSKNDRCYGIKYKTIWKKDILKINNLENSGYKVICIWESFYDNLLQILNK